tara:strand:+ start:1513 stop:2037 length:525 start_codon:yes stop_codon:yes gene_type:complete
MDNNNMNIIQKHNLQLLGIQEVTTKQQEKNGTREFKLPVRDQYGVAIHVASFASGYVRRTKANGYSPSWQLNKTKKSKRYVTVNTAENGTYARTFESIERILIPNEQDRIEYLIAFCLKNYYIGQANKLSSGEFIPKWKYEAYKDEHSKLANIINESENPEVKVIINGHRYNIT